MTEDGKVMDLIVDELTEVKEKHAVPRRTMIKPEEGERDCCELVLCDFNDARGIVHPRSRPLSAEFALVPGRAQGAQ